jgi:hypothetical protein
MDGRDEMGQEIAREIAHTIARKIAIGIALFLAFVVFIFVGGYAVQLLWNWLLPDLLGVRAVTFWEALGLLALCRILFGGFGRSGGGHGSSRRKHWRNGDRKEWWKPSAPSAPRDPAGSAPAAGIAHE